MRLIHRRSFSRFQDSRRAAAQRGPREPVATGNTAAPPWRKKARPRPGHRTAASTGSPKNNRDQAIGRSVGDGGTAPLEWGAISGAVPGGPR